MTRQGHGDGGKGDRPRKSDTAKYASNWDAIYNKPTKKKIKDKKLDFTR